jgi:hypothetical protein
VQDGAAVLTQNSIVWPLDALQTGVALDFASKRLLGQHPIPGAGQTVFFKKRVVGGRSSGRASVRGKELKQLRENRSPPIG